MSALTFSNYSITSLRSLALSSGSKKFSAIMWLIKAKFKSGLQIDITLKVLFVILMKLSSMCVFLRLVEILPKTPKSTGLVIFRPSAYAFSVAWN